MILLERANEVEVADAGQSDDDLQVECGKAKGFRGVTRSGGRIFLTFTEETDIETALVSVALSRMPIQPLSEA